MVIDIQDGVLIAGDSEELAGLIETLTTALDDGAAEGQMLTEDGVERVFVTRLDA